MVEIKGDLFEEIRISQYDAICCTTNQTLNKKGELIMGKGIALQFKKGFPELPKIWGSMIDNGIINIFATKVDRPLYSGYVVSLPTKIDWRFNSDLKLIEWSIRQLDIVSRAIGWKKILMTRPGCGEGGLKWDEVKLIMEHQLDDRYFIINK